MRGNDRSWRRYIKSIKTISRMKKNIFYYTSFNNNIENYSELSIHQRINSHNWFLASKKSIQFNRKNDYKTNYYKNYYRCKVKNDTKNIIKDFVVN